MASSASFGVHIAPETVAWATTPASPTWEFFPVEPTSGVPVFDNIFDDARRGLPAIGFNQLAGVQRTELSLSGPVYPSEMGWFLKCIFGGVTNSGTADPYTHLYDVLAAPDADGLSMLVQLQDDSVANGYTHRGCFPTGITFRFNAGEGLITHETTLLGYGMSTAIAASAAVDATDDPFRGWQMDVTTSAGLGASPGRLIEGEISIARDADLLYVASNSQNPVQCYPGLVAVTGRLMCSFDVEGDLEVYTTDPPEALILQCSYLDGAASRSLDFEFPKLSYRESPAEIDRSGNNMTISYNIRGLLATTGTVLGAASTDMTNVRVRLRNAMAAYTHPAS